MYLETIKVLEPGLLADVLLMTISKKMFSLYTFGEKKAHFVF